MPDTGRGAAVIYCKGIAFFLITIALCSCVTENGASVSSVPAPVIDTVSQGISTEFIRIDWQTDTASVVQFQIYRASAENGPYEPLTVVNAAASVNFYYDSVKAVQVYYYTIAAIDSKGRMSSQSAGKHGIISATPPAPPVLSLDVHPDHIALSWTPYPGAADYAVYRSVSACTTATARIGRTSSIDYSDSSLPSGLCYYHVAALDISGREASNSNCAWGALHALPAPAGVRAENGEAGHTLHLQWDSIAGSREYVIYRASGKCPDAVQEYARTKTAWYIDTIKKAGYFYYAIAAVNRAAQISAMSVCLRGAAGLLSPPESLSASYDERPNIIALSWKALSQAHHYVIYRALGTCSLKMRKIDSSTTAPKFTDNPPTSDTCSYMVAGVDSFGIEGLPSSCVSGRVKLLPAPANIKTSNGLYVNRIRISWDPVAGADGYICYRGNSNVASLATPVDTVTSLFLFDSVPSTTLYYYWVEARDRLGPGKRSTYRWGRTFIPPTLDISGVNDSTYILSWKTDTTATKWKYIYRGSFQDEVPFKFDSTIGLSDTIILNDYTGYRYSIVARTSVGDSAFSDPIELARRPPAPTGLVAIGDSIGVSLHWNPIPGVSGYLIYRSDSLTETIYGYALDGASDTFYVDYSATAARYYYQVSASGDGGESDRSAIVEAGILNPPGRRP
jgi:fibronectin type 3 domain-containing protein